MPRYCCIFTCINFTGCSDYSKTSFFRPPMDITKRKQWIEEIKKYQKIDPNFTICHLHFEEEHLRLEKESGKYRLRPNAIPTVFDTKPNQQIVNLVIEEDESVHDTRIQLKPIVHTYGTKKEVPVVPVVHTYGTRKEVPLVRIYGIKKEVPVSTRAINIQPIRNANVELPVQTSKMCSKCIHTDTQVQAQQIKIKGLQHMCKSKQNMINHLRSQLVKCKSLISKYESISAGMGPNSKVIREKCSICRAYNPSNKYHTCNGEEKIYCEYCGESFTTTTGLVAHLSISHTQRNFYKCEKCPEIFAAAILMEFHSKRHPSVEPELICDICNMKYHTIYQMKNHMNEMHSGKSDGILRAFQCGICGKNYVDGPGLHIHMTQIHTKALGNFECFLCKIKLKSLYDTKRHLKLHERPKKCEVCNETYTKREFEGHLCGGLKDINCVYCNQYFKSTKNLLKHLKDNCKEDKLIYKCEACYKFFPMELLRDIHSKQHTVVSKKFACDICSKSFINAKLLSSHEKRHQKEKDHLCEECGKGFISLRNLNLHKRTHGEREFKCPDCGQTFILQDQLRKHSLRHQNLRFVCSVCDANLSSLRGLSKHMKIHTRTENDRKFACSMCPKKFFDAKMARRHLQLTHSNFKPYVCQFCQKSYKYDGDLTKHLRQMHLGDDMYACPECPKRFRLFYEFERHKFVHYKQSKDESNGETK